jgi:hypothetical protein
MRQLLGDTGVPRGRAMLLGLCPLEMARQFATDDGLERALALACVNAQRCRPMAGRAGRSCSRAQPDNCGTTLRISSGRMQAPAAGECGSG